MTFSSCCNQPWKVFLIWLTNHGHESQGLTCFFGESVWIYLYKHPGFQAMLSVQQRPSNPVFLIKNFIIFESPSSHKLVGLWWGVLGDNTLTSLCFHLSDFSLAPDFWHGLTTNFTTAGWNRSFWNMGKLPFLRVVFLFNQSRSQERIATKWRAIWIRRFRPATARLLKFRRTCLTWLLLQFLEGWKTPLGHSGQIPSAKILAGKKGMFISSKAMTNERLRPVGLSALKHISWTSVRDLSMNSSPAPQELITTEWFMLALPLTRWAAWS